MFICAKVPVHTCLFCFEIRDTALDTCARNHNGFHTKRVLRVRFQAGDWSRDGRRPRKLQHGKIKAKITVLEFIDHITKPLPWSVNMMDRKLAVMLVCICDAPSSAETAFVYFNHNLFEIRK